MKKIILGVFLFLLSSSLQAITIYTECGDCNSYEKEIIAKQIASGQSGSVHDVLLMNTETFSLSKLRIVNIQSHEPGVPPTTIFHDVQLSGKEIQLRDQIQDHYDGLLTMQIPTDVLESAWELSGDVTKQTELINWARRNESILSIMTHYISSMLEVADLINDINANLELYTVDGDVVLLKLEYISNDLLLSYSVDSAWDLVNLENESYNRIPWTKDEWGREGVYKIRDSEYDLFSEAATRFNMSVGLGGGGGGGDGVGPTLECRPPEDGYGIVCKKL